MDAIEIEDRMMRNGRDTFIRDDVDNHGRLNPSELKRAFSVMHIMITMDEAKRIQKRFDSNKNGGLEINEFPRCIRSAHPPSTILFKFRELDMLHRNYLVRSQTKELLQSLGHFFSPQESKLLFDRFQTADDEEIRFTFDIIYKLASSSHHFSARRVHEEPIPINPPRPARWNEVVLATHTIFRAFMTSVLVFFALKSADTTPSTAPKIPFVSQLTKGLHERGMDKLIMCCVVGWGGFYILSFRARGFMTSKIMDGPSLLCALILMSSLVWYVNDGLPIIPCLMCAGVGFGLGIMHDWEV